MNPGTRLGSYEIQDTIAAGGRAKVYCAQRGVLDTNDYLEGVYLNLRKTPPPSPYILMGYPFAVPSVWKNSKENHIGEKGDPLENLVEPGPTLSGGG